MCTINSPNRTLWGKAASCPPVAGVNNGPKHVLVLVPRTCPYVTFQGKGVFTDVVKFRILCGEIILDYPDGGPSVITRVFISESGRQRVKEVGWGTRGWEVQMAALETGGALSHGTQAPPEAGKR